MNISRTDHGGSTKAFYAGNLLAGRNTGLKSTQEKLDRQQKATSQIQFWENQKDNLKNMKCDTLEEIARKLEMFHTYEDQIAAAKAAYNQEQMMHIMDEAEEKAEKMAEAAEKMEPKTPEERREEQIEEALGTEETDGLLSDLMDAIEPAEITEPAESTVPAESSAETLEELRETEETLDELTENTEKLRRQRNAYRPFDTRI